MRFPLSLACVFACASAAVASASDALSLSNADWTVKIDSASGAIIGIRNARDPQSFNFLREPGRWERREWVADTSEAAVSQGGQWGLVETAGTGLLHAAQVRRVSSNVVESEYRAPFLTVVVRRELDSQTGALAESYTFKNTGMLDLELPAGSLAINAPLFDQYPDAARSLAARCHAHLWMGGDSAWINAMRMGANPPHLGLVMTEGALVDYSQRGGTLSDRGVFLLHPAAMKIPGGQSRTISWKLFWHGGWDDFFAKARELSENFVRLAAKRYTVVAGEALEVTATGAKELLAGAQFFADGKRLRPEKENTLRIPTEPGRCGEMLIELAYGPQNKLRTRLVANVVPPLDELVRKRVEFIVRNQQRRAPGDPLDGAYLAYDNETGRQVYAAKPSDHNAGRERVGMGILGAMYLPLCKDAALKAGLADSLARYAAFVARELEGDDGTVYGSIGRENDERLYNFPWVARFHLAMFKATGECDHLDRFVRVVRRFYARGGAAFYPIGMPVSEGLETLAKAGEPRAADYAELLKNFRANADAIIKTGKNYPPFEVNYEQSIVAPAVQFLLEFHHATGERKYLDGAREQMPLAEAFNGRQPDHHLHEVAIRHWDDYWFGKLKLYGDTFPHYWSCVTGLAYAFYGKAMNDPGWLARAEAAIHGNLSLFTPDGRGSAAHVYPYSTNGARAAQNDPWANDQDWALVHLLLLDRLGGSAGKIRHEEIRVDAPFVMPAIRVPVFPARDFVITDFGAKPGATAQAANTAAIRNAIAACHDAGGGRVVIPAGTWTTGAIHLRSNVNLHLAKGAVLSFSDDPADYLPAVQTSWEGWECFNYSPLIYAFECENIALSGEGKIAPRMDTWKKWYTRPPAHMDALKRLYTMGSTGVPVEKRRMAEGENNLRPHLIQFNRCKNALIENVTIRNSPFWTIHLLLCDGVVVRGVDVYAHGHNNDGIDPENTRNLLVENCTFDQGDDAIVIKSGSNQDGWRLNTPSENIVIRNCLVKNGHQIIAIGSELSGGVRNVYAHDIRFDAGAQDGHAVTPFNVLYIKTNRRRGGVIENITVENIDASKAKFRMGVFGIETDILYQWRKLVPTYEERITAIRDITVRNIKAGETATPFLISGDKDKPVRNVTIENITIGTVRGQKNHYEHAENVREKNIAIGTYVEAPYKESANK